jgi:purine-binding chemotaxis protein CheW
MASAKQLCTFFVGDGYFGIPVEQVQEIVRPQPITPVPLAPRVVRGLINLRGQILTAIDLRRRLNVPERLGDQLPLNVVVRTADGALSLLVDEIGDVVEVLEETFERSPETLQGVSRELILGVHKLPQGLLLVLDTEKVVNLLESDALVSEAQA